MVVYWSHENTRNTLWRICHPPRILTKDSICYCIGAGEDISFDVRLAEEYGCRVFIFDPTPRSHEHFSRLMEDLKNGIDTPINNFASKETYRADSMVLPLLSFHPFGIWNKDQTVRFYGPRKAHYVSYFIHPEVNDPDLGKYFDAECYTITSIMGMLGHRSIDLVKVNVAGAEHEIIDSILRSGVRPAVMCISFHNYWAWSWKLIPLHIKIFRTERKLKRAGYEKAWYNGGQHFTYVKAYRSRQR